MAQFELFANTYKNGMRFLYTFSVYPKYIFNITIHLHRKMSEFNTMRFNILKKKCNYIPMNIFTHIIQKLPQNLSGMQCALKMLIPVICCLLVINFKRTDYSTC